MVFKKLQLMVWLFALFAATMGCTLFSWSSRAEEAPAEEVLFFDDFSDPPSGWGLQNREGAQVDYFAESLRFLVRQPQNDVWSVTGKNYQDISVEVDAIKFAGPDNNDFGVICRYQDRKNFYMLVISSDGYYGIVQIKDGQYRMIGSTELQYSESIRNGQAVNHLRADCVGDVLRLYVNGQMLIEARNADFLSGDVGLVAGAYQEEGVEILFDNFMVKRLVD